MLKNKNLIKVVTVLAVMIMSTMILAGCELKKEKGNNEQTAVEGSYEEPVKNFVEGLNEANSEKFLKAFPSFIADYVKDIFTDDYLKMYFGDAKETYGDNTTMTYNIKDKTELSEEDLRAAEQNVKTSFDKDITVTKGYKLNVELRLKGDNKEDTEKEIINVFEVDGNWYLLNF